MKELKFLFFKIKAFIQFLFFSFKKGNTISNSSVVLFFPYYHIGGAEKVHANIIKSLEGKVLFILFEGKSNIIHQKESFINNNNYYEIYNFLNRSSIIKNLFIKFIANKINKGNVKSVFASNSSVFYQILPKLSPKIDKIDLTHAFSYPDVGGEITSLPYVKYLTKRIVINKKTYLDYKELYKKHNLLSFFSRIEIISNGVTVKKTQYIEKEKGKINIAYVGRWSKEKRPELFLKIAKEVSSKNKNFNFFFAGTSDDKHKKIIVEHNVVCLGEIKDSKTLYKYYKQFHYILITSYREGFPMVLMEAMHFGVVPICTNVGGISEHVKDSENGFLIENFLDESKISNNFITLLLSLYPNNNFKTISKNCFSYAHKNFSLKKFKSSYQKLFSAN